MRGGRLFLLVEEEDDNLGDPVAALVDLGMDGKDVVSDLQDLDRMGLVVLGLDADLRLVDADRRFVDSDLCLVGEDLEEKVDFGEEEDTSDGGHGRTFRVLLFRPRL